MREGLAGRSVAADHAAGIFDLRMIAGLSLLLLAAAAGCSVTEEAGPFSEGGHLVSGGVPPDGIVALNSPPRTTADQMPGNILAGDEHVLGVYVNGVAMAYPVKVMDWHEVANDVVGGLPIALTYCPLTGTGIGFDRRISVGVPTFGVSGLLCDNNLVMYDRATQSLFPQMAYEGVRGELFGERLDQVHVVEMPWSRWRTIHPDSEVLDISLMEDGSFFNYGIYPYGTYYTSSRVSFPLRNTDDRLHAKERVHGVRVGDTARVYPLVDLPAVEAVNDTLGGLPIVVFGSDDQGFATAFFRTVGGTARTFEMASTLPPEIRDTETGTVWDVHGRAVSGPDAGLQLAPVEGFTGFFFAWATFHDGVTIWQPAP